MDYIKSKNICSVVVETLSLIDSRLIEHGKKTAYILWKLLEEKDTYEEFELAEFVFWGTIHDIGAYKTENINKLLRFECKDYMKHSIYGYIFMRYLSPMKKRAKILLYHHTNYQDMKKTTFEESAISDCLHLADTIAIFHDRLQDKFDYKVFERYKETRFSPSAVDTFMRLEKEDSILKHIEDGSYEAELDDLMESIMFTNEEKKEYLEMLMYCLGFRTSDMIADTYTTMFISREIGKRLGLNDHQLEVLYYASLLHDMGMLAIPRSILKLQRPMTEEEKRLVHSHVDVESKSLVGKLSQEVMEVVATHHERADGSGYPQGLKDSQMNVLQRIFQVADAASHLINKRYYHEMENKGEVLEVMRAEMEAKRFNRQVVESFLANYKAIMKRVAEKEEEVGVLHTTLQQKYQNIAEKTQKLTGSGGNKE